MGKRLIAQINWAIKKDVPQIITFFFCDGNNSGIKKFKNSLESKPIAKINKRYLIKNKWYGDDRKKRIKIINSKRLFKK